MATKRHKTPIRRYNMTKYRLKTTSERCKAATRTCKSCTKDTTLLQREAQWPLRYEKQLQRHAK